MVFWNLDICPGMPWYLRLYVYRKLTAVRSANCRQMPAVFQLSEICLVSPPHCLLCKAKPLNDRCCCLNIQWQKCLVNHRRPVFRESPDSKFWASAYRSMVSAAPLFLHRLGRPVSALCIPPRMVNEEDQQSATLHEKGCDVV